MTLSHALAFPTLRAASDIAMGKMRRQFILNPGRAADRARQPRMAQCRDAQDMPRARLLLTRPGDLSRTCPVTFCGAFCMRTSSVGGQLYAFFAVSARQVILGSIMLATLKVGIQRIPPFRW
jgi:hypothetical protein